MRSLLIRLGPIALAISLLLLANHAIAAPDGATLYKQKCAGCHGADGKAETPTAKAMKVPALAGKGLAEKDVVDKVRTNEKHKALSKLSDEELAAIAGALPQ
jgi:mono/diheme cytochrome c family protein